MVNSEDSDVRETDMNPTSTFNSGRDSVSRDNKRPYGDDKRSYGDNKRPYGDNKHPYLSAVVRIK